MRASEAVRRKARKRHRCYDCYKSIEPGELYDRYCVFDVGDVMTGRTCLECAEWIKQWPESVPDESYVGWVQDARRELAEWQQEQEAYRASGPKTEVCMSTEEQDKKQASEGVAQEARQAHQGDDYMVSAQLVMPYYAFQALNEVCMEAARLMNASEVLVEVSDLSEASLALRDESAQDPVKRRQIMTSICARFLVELTAQHRSEVK